MHQNLSYDISRIGLDISAIETIITPYWFHSEEISMPNLTVKNIPDELYLRLKEVARAHHRSLNSEIIFCVEKTLGTHRVDITEHLAIARKLRLKTVSHPITTDELIAEKNAGRP